MLLCCNTYISYLLCIVFMRIKAAEERALYLELFLSLNLTSATKLPVWPYTNYLTSLSLGFFISWVSAHMAPSRILSITLSNAITPFASLFFIASSTFQNHLAYLFD